MTMNTKRYYLCHFPEQRALSYGPVPEVWGSITGMLGLDNETLADLSNLGYPGYGFIQDGADDLKRIFPNSLSTARAVAAQLSVDAMKVDRDNLLAASDSVMMIDRWEKYTPEKKAAIAAYRQALRDMPVTIEDPFDFGWPEAPF